MTGSAPIGYDAPNDWSNDENVHWTPYERRVVGAIGDTSEYTLASPVDRTLDDLLARNGVDERTRTFLFAPLPTLDAATVREFARRGLLATSMFATWPHPFDWSAFCDETTSDNTTSVYAATLVRLHMLNDMARHFDAIVRDHDENTMPAYVRSLAHYLHLWIDAHALFVCALEDAPGGVPNDRSALVIEALRAYAPTARTVFTGGELPALSPSLTASPLFVDASVTTAHDRPLLTICSKVLPHRAEARDIVTTIEDQCLRSRAVFCAVQAMLAASLLGVYRSANSRPSLMTRMRLYRFFFYVPDERMRAALEQHANEHGATYSGTAVFRRHFVQENTAADVVLGNYATNMARVTQAAQAAAGNKRTRRTGGGARAAAVAAVAAVLDDDDERTRRQDRERRRQVYAWMTAIRYTTSAKDQREQRTYINQEALVTAVREYVLFQLHYDVFTRNALVDDDNDNDGGGGEWVAWETAVIAAGDTMRDRVDASASVGGGGSGNGRRTRHILDATAGLARYASASAAAATSVHQRTSFYELLARTCMSYLDNQGGSENTLDAPWTVEMDLTLRACVRNVPWAADVELTPVDDLPLADMTVETWHDEYLARGRFPLRLFDAKLTVVWMVAAVRDAYARTGSIDYVNSLVRLIGRDSLFQLQLVHAFAQANVDRVNVRAVPLPAHIARYQADALRRRWGFAPDERAPDVLMAYLVCTRCRTFRGHTTPAVDVYLTAKNIVDGTQTFESTIGMRKVMLVDECDQTRVARRVRERGNRLAGRHELDVRSEVPNGSERQLGGRVRKYDNRTRLVDWYKREAVVNGRNSLYPPVPSDYRATPADLERTRQFIDRPLPEFEVDMDAPMPALRESSTQLTAVPPPFDMTMSIDDFYRVHERVLNVWNTYTGGHLRVGHWTPRPDLERSLVWVCADKNSDQIAKKDRQAIQRREQAAQKEQRARDRALRDAKDAVKKTETKRRHDAHLHYRASLCARTRCDEVRLLGYALQMDSNVYVACVACLGVATLHSMRWRADRLLCAACACAEDILATRAYMAALNGDGATAAGAEAAAADARLAMMTQLRCRACSNQCRANERYWTFDAFDDVSVGSECFVQVTLCERHVAKGRFVHASPFFMTLSAVDAGLQYRKKSRRFVYDPNIDYLARLMRAGGDEDGAEPAVDEVADDVQRLIERGMRGAERRATKAAQRLHKRTRTAKQTLPLSASMAAAASTTVNDSDSDSGSELDDDDDLDDMGDDDDDDDGGGDDMDDDDDCMDDDGGNNA